MRDFGVRLAVGSVATVVALTLAAVGAQAASPKWTIVLPKNSSSTQKNAMDGVSCVSTTFCFAVGGYYTGGNPNPVIKHTQIEKWNGTSWSVVPSPNKTGGTAASNFLNGVSCTSTSFCIAVGYYTQTGGHPDQTLVEKWNGTSWSISPTPNVASKSNDLNAVSCYRKTFCMAAGQTVDGSFLTQTLTERWNGTAWSIVSSPNSKTTQSNFLWGVSCSTASFCLAVGYHDTSTGDVALSLRWNGSGWSLLSTPNHSGGASNPTDALWSVSCVKHATNFCMAAGDYLNVSHLQRTLAEKWNGTSWSVVASPNKSPTQGDGLYSGVSCSASTFCMDATFTSPMVGHQQTVILKWNGTSLAIVASPNTSTAQDNRLQATSCISNAFCGAVGQYTPAASLISHDLSEIWR
jgi:putative hemolysin